MHTTSIAHLAGVALQLRNKLEVGRRRLLLCCCGAVAGATVPPPSTPACLCTIASGNTPVKSGST